MLRLVIPPGPAVFAFLLPPGLMILLALAGEPVGAALSYQRDAVAGGEWWRFYTGNLVHFTSYHAVMNVAGLLFAAAFLFRYLPVKLWVASLVVIPLAVTIGIHWLNPQYTEYRGFSGVLYGALAAGLLAAWRQQPWLYLLAFGLLLGKIVFEQLPGYDRDYLVQQIGVPVATNAHLYGVCAGILIASAYGLVCYRRKAGRSPSWP